MTTESELRDVLGDRAASAGAVAPFDSVRSRADHLRRRRFRILTLGLTLTVIATAGVVAATQRDTEHVRVATDPTTTAPSTDARADLLVVTRAGRLSVWRDGNEQRVLGNVPGVRELGVTPDGQTAVLVQDAHDSTPPPDCDVPRLARMDLSAGSPPEMLVGFATKAMISPDGARVAYWYACDGQGVGLTSLTTGDNWRVSTSEASRPLAWSGPTSLLYAVGVAAPDGGEGWETWETTFTGGGWPEGSLVDLGVSYPVAQPWVANGTDAIFGVGSRLDSNREITDAMAPIHDFGREGAQEVVAITSTTPGDLHDLVVTTERSDGTRQVWRVLVDDDLRSAVGVEELDVPDDVVAVAPLTAS